MLRDQNSCARDNSSCLLWADATYKAHHSIPIQIWVFFLQPLRFIIGLPFRYMSDGRTFWALESVGRQIKPGPNGFGKPLSVHLLQALHVASESCAYQMIYQPRIPHI